MVPAQEKGAWGIGEEGGESNEAAGEFGQESGEGGAQVHVLQKHDSFTLPWQQK